MVVTSAGTADIWPEIDRNTVDAAAAAGIDLSDHRRRTLSGELVGTDGADLVLTMTRAQLRLVAALDAGAWPRTFTLLELARRAVAVPAEPDESVTAWLRRVASDRRAAEMMGADAADDVADPYGGSPREHAAMVRQVGEAVTALVRHGPWIRSA